MALTDIASLSSLATRYFFQRVFQPSRNPHSLKTTAPSRPAAVAKDLSALLRSAAASSQPSISAAFSPGAPDCSILGAHGTFTGGSAFVFRWEMLRSFSLIRIIIAQYSPISHKYSVFSVETSS